jgi:hypothetical protein
MDFRVMLEVEEGFWGYVGGKLGVSLILSSREEDRKELNGN